MATAEKFFFVINGAKEIQSINMKPPKKTIPPAGPSMPILLRIVFMGIIMFIAALIIANRKITAISFKLNWAVLI